MRTDALVAAAALCLSTATLVLVAPAAHGDDDVLTTVSPASSEGVCPLRRVGDQFVRCDNLTGAGVPAPTWIPLL